MNPSDMTPAQRRRLRRKRARRRRNLQILLLAVLVLAVAVGGYFAWRWWPRPYYSAAQLGLHQIESDHDADGDGIEDYMDMVEGARAYIETDPHYESKYYAGGYPDDGHGVCTDVIWHAFEAAGYSLKDMVDMDIEENRGLYPFIEVVDSNIDFRRVNTLDTFFRRHAQKITCSLDDPEDWQPGDIVIFGDRDHIGICSDRRSRDGIPFLIHHGNPIDDAVEQSVIREKKPTGHYRWQG